jgi:hypothetical protein
VATAPVLRPVGGWSLPSTPSHGPEMLMALWLRCWQQLGNVPFNVKLVR